MSYGALGQQIVIDPLAIPDPVLQDLSLRAFDAVWPTMQTRLREEMKRERMVTFALAGAVVLSFFGAAAIIRKR